LGKLDQLAVLIGKLDIRESLSNTLIHGPTFLKKLLSALSESEITLLACVIHAEESAAHAVNHGVKAGGRRHSNVQVL
jgi:hypothetical protein